jgi:hypothetical protein
MYAAIMMPVKTGIIPLCGSLPVAHPKVTISAVGCNDKSIVPYSVVDLICYDADTRCPAVARVVRGDVCDVDMSFARVHVVLQLAAEAKLINVIASYFELDEYIRVHSAYILCCDRQGKMLRVIRLDLDRIVDSVSPMRRHLASENGEFEIEPQYVRYFDVLLNCSEPALLEHHGRRPYNAILKDMKLCGELVKWDQVPDKQSDKATEQKMQRRRSQSFTHGVLPLMDNI